MRTRFLFSLLVLWLPLGWAHAGDAYQAVTVADPYIELHTGPGRGYPVFHVIERGEPVVILKRRTDWFRLRSADGNEGWAYVAQLERTLAPSGDAMRFAQPGRQEFSRRRWEAGVLGGDFGGAAVLSVYGAYALIPILSAELSVSHVPGEFSESLLGNAGLVAQPYPDWRLSPFFTLGTGVARTNPSTRLVQAEDRTNQVAHWGIGARMHLTRRFVLRVEYKNYVFFQSRDENEEVDEWKAGFAVFF